MFCDKCGTEITEKSKYCQSCGAGLKATCLEISAENNSGQGEIKEFPDEIKGWSWGGFFLNWIWAIGNKTWIGLLALLPGIGFIMAIILGIKGRQWAWQNKKWDSVEHFQRVQKKWSFWGVLFVIATIVILAGLSIPAYQDYTTKARLYEVIITSQTTKTAVETYAIEKREWPTDIKALNISQYPDSPYIQSIEIDRGVIYINLSSELDAVGTMVYIPEVKDNVIVWNCKDSTVQKKYLPSECQ